MAPTAGDFDKISVFLPRGFCIGTGRLRDFDIPLGDTPRLPGSLASALSDDLLEEGFKEGVILDIGVIMRLSSAGDFEKADRGTLGSFLSRSLVSSFDGVEPFLAIGMPGEGGPSSWANGGRLNSFGGYRGVGGDRTVLKALDGSVT